MKGTMMTLLDIQDTLNGLIGVGKDAEAAFIYCARRARSFALHMLFQRRADDARRSAQTMQQQLSQHGGLPREAGTAAGDLRLSWLAVRCAMSANPDGVLVEFCERSDACAQLHFEGLLRQPLPEAIRAMVALQLETIRDDAPRIHALRDRLRYRE